MYVISEVGSNFYDVDDCHEAIRLSAKAGADAVKFQMFSYRDLYGHGSDKPLGIELRWLDQLSEEAEKWDLDFMVTGFVPESVKLLTYYVDKHKIASSCAADPFMMRAALESNLPLICSLGGKTYKQCVDIISGVPDGYNATFLYCVSDYPACNIDWRKMEAIAELCEAKGFATGFSDHTLSTTPIYPVNTIEKHTNLLGVTGKPDCGHSLNYDEFSRFVKNCKHYYPQWDTSDLEPGMIEQHNKRLVLTEDVKKGDQLVMNQNYGIYRITSPNLLQVEPCHWEIFNEKRVTRDVYKGEALRLSDIK